MFFTSFYFFSVKMKTFLFYDIETSGLHRVFDQILTFASIRTDHKFNEIERNSFIINLRKDIVPSAKAFLTHGLTYEELEKGISEYESAIKIHKILNTKNTINLGYNSLGFDDVFLRFMFYRNLLDPYTHQYRNGCSRMDLLPITTLFKVFLPDTLKWPMVEDKPSLKLDKLSRENNFVTSGKAHQAMSDVEAVIELSKALSMQESVWKYSLDFFNKTKEENRINDMKANIKIEDRFFKLGILISIHFGSKLNYMAPVIYLGRSKQYVNQKLFLRLDSKDILKQKSDTNNTGIIRKKVADAMILLPVKERFLAKMPEFSSKIAKENIKILHDNSKRFLSSFNIIAIIDILLFLISMLMHLFIKMVFFQIWKEMKSGFSTILPMIKKKKF